VTCSCLSCRPFLVAEQLLILPDKGKRFDLVVVRQIDGNLLLLLNLPLMPAKEAVEGDENDSVVRHVNHVENRHTFDQADKRASTLSFEDPFRCLCVATATT
jgi:hypothetical protein